MYIESIEILKDYRSLYKGDSFLFENIVLLVGDQGCGKSILLEGLQNQRDYIRVNLTRIGKMGVNSFFFDSEKMNPRMKDPISYSNVDGTSRGIGVGNALCSRFQSHGEVLKTMTVDALHKAQDCIIFLDEPEAGLSLKNQFALLREINLAVGRNCQMIVSTHSLVLIQGINRVLSLENRGWMSSEEFIQLNRNE